MNLSKMHLISYVRNYFWKEAKELCLIHQAGPSAHNRESFKEWILE